VTDFVLDTSVTMAWCFPDEETPETRGLFVRMSANVAIVPAIWPLEVASVLLIGERRQRLTQAQTAQFLQLLRSFAITVDALSPMTTIHSVMTLSREHSLSSYDASYLELAIRHGLPLATLDQKLRAAAQAVGVSLL
jgi:predicted nucleic acid-binding protein